MSARPQFSRMVGTHRTASSRRITGPADRGASSDPGLRIDISRFCRVHVAAFDPIPKCRRPAHRSRNRQGDAGAHPPVSAISKILSYSANPPGGNRRNKRNNRRIEKGGNRRIATPHAPFTPRIAASAILPRLRPVVSARGVGRRRPDEGIRISPLKGGRVASS